MMLTEKPRLVEILWDLIIEDRDQIQPTSQLVGDYADRILADIDGGLINRNEEV